MKMNAAAVAELLLGMAKPILDPEAREEGVELGQAIQRYVKGTDERWDDMTLGTATEFIDGVLEGINSPLPTNAAADALDVA